MITKIIIKKYLTNLIVLIVLTQLFHGISCAKIAQPQVIKSPTFKSQNDNISPKAAGSSSNKKQKATTEGFKNFVASGLAAAIVKITLAPFDTTKTIQQRSRLTSSQALSFWDAAKLATTTKERGFLGLYAGVGVTVVGAMPSVGLYFGIYSYSKRVIGNLFEKYSHNRKRLCKIVTIASSAAIGNTIASVARVPYEVMKQKLQTGEFTNTLSAFHTMLSSPNPLLAFFPLGSIQSQMIRDIPYAMVSLLTYEHLREHWVKRVENPTVFHDMLVGAVAGGIGSYVTNPMDVVKTRLQTDKDYLGVWDCARRVWSEEGFSGFLKGSKPRLMHKIPANAVFFVAYEFFRRILNVEQSLPDK